MNNQKTKWQEIKEATQPLNNKFELNGKWFMTDNETIKVIRTVIDGYHETGDTDSSAVMAIMLIGTMTGRIQELEQ